MQKAAERMEEDQWKTSKEQKYVQDRELDVAFIELVNLEERGRERFTNRIFFGN